MIDIATTFIRLQQQVSNTKQAYIDFQAVVKQKAQDYIMTTRKADKHTAALSPLSQGKYACMQNPLIGNWQENGRVISVRPDRQSYLIDVNNKRLIRACRMLQPATPENAEAWHSGLPSNVPQHTYRTRSIPSRMQILILVYMQALLKKLFYSYFST